MRKLEDAQNAPAPDAAYPKSRIKDDSGSGDGVPVNEFVYGDLMQMTLKIVADSGIIENGLADNDTNGYQLYEALKAVIRKTMPPLSAWISITDGVNYDVEYRKTNLDSVQVRITAILALPTGPLVVLPVGFRPTKTVLLNLSSISTSDSNIGTNGQIFLGIGGLPTSFGSVYYFEFPLD